MLIVAISEDGNLFPLPKEEQISEWIRSAREERGLSLQAVADHVGVARQAVWIWEKGKSVPMLEHLSKLLDVLGPPKTAIEASLDLKNFTKTFNDDNKKMEEIESILGV